MTEAPQRLCKSGVARFFGTRHRPHLRTALMAALFAGVSHGTAFGACPAATDMALMAARHAARQTLEQPAETLDIADARCGRAHFVRFLEQNHGPVVGYKAALTSAVLQQRFNHPHPIRGMLLERMLLREGTDVAAHFGARPMFEADLMVEVKDEDINRARTPAQVLQHVSRLFPFIELPDLLVENPAQLTGAGITLLNAGARLGVMGRPIEVTPSPPLLDALANMKVTLLTQDGELDSAPGSSILGHPLEAVLWLIRDLAHEGLSLKPGDLISLGSFSRLHPAKPGIAATVRYVGLPGDPSVTVRFR